MSAPRNASSARRVQIKVCGLTNPDEAGPVAEAGVDALGLVFWPRSPRAVDLARARQVVAALPPFVLRVGVFVDASLDELRRAVDEVGLDLLQLHGQEPPAFFERLPRRAIKALAAGADFDLEQACAYAPHTSALLLDAQSTLAPGGTGARCDWDVARRVRARVPRLVLAGGLTPDNVQAAIAAVQPDAVDVSSGVESAPGRKDPARVRAFVANVRRAAGGMP
jgi:phosphoribosylanthranilate isomerase